MMYKKIDYKKLSTYVYITLFGSDIRPNVFTCTHVLYYCTCMRKSKAFRMSDLF